MMTFLSNPLDIVLTVAFGENHPESGLFFPPYQSFARDSVWFCFLGLSTEDRASIIRSDGNAPCVRVHLFRQSQMAKRYDYLMFL